MKWMLNKQPPQYSTTSRAELLILKLFVRKVYQKLVLLVKSLKVWYKGIVGKNKLLFSSW